MSKNYARGENHPKAVLTYDKVLHILECYYFCPRKYQNGIRTALARFHGVHIETIRGVISRRVWKHVEFDTQGEGQCDPHILKMVMEERKRVADELKRINATKRAAAIKQR